MKLVLRDKDIAADIDTSTFDAAVAAATATDLASVAQAVEAYNSCIDAIHAKFQVCACVCVNA